MQPKNLRHLVKKDNLKPKHYLFFAIILVLVAALYIDYYSGGITKEILSYDLEEFRITIENFGIIAPLIFIILVVIEVMIAPIPGFIFYVTGAAIFGWFWGGVLTIIGNMIGASICFYLARYLGRDYAEKKIDKRKMDRFDKYAQKFGGYAIFLLRINPLTSSDLFSYAAGFSKISFRKFFLGTLFGLLPLSFIQSYFGESLLNISPKLYWAIAAISIIYFVIAVYVIYLSTENTGNEGKI